MQAPIFSLAIFHGTLTRSGFAPSLSLLVNFLVFVLLPIATVDVLEGKLSDRAIHASCANESFYRFGYVEFSNADDAAKAFEAKQDTELDGRKINLDFANARQNNAGTADRAQSRAKTFGDQTSPESDTLFIGNISFDADENMLQETFSSHGSILGIRLPTDPDSGRPKGFGYVQFSSVDEARSALGALQGADVGGRPVRLDFSTPRQNSGGSGFGGGFGGRGGRGGGRGRGGPRGGSRGGPRGGGRGGRGGSTNRGGFGDFSGKKITF